MEKGHGVGINSGPEKKIVIGHEEMMSVDEMTQATLNSAIRKQEAYESLVQNATIMRSELLSQFLNPGKDINFECGYPDSIEIGDYKRMYDRVGVAARVVDIFPDESWSVRPIIYETEDTDETKFEKVWKELERKYRIIHYLHRMDTLSGIGRFGVLVIGINDGKTLDKPVAGIDLRTGGNTTSKTYELLYLKPFDESAVQVQKKVTDVNNPRYGYPEVYNISFDSEDVGLSNSKVMKVHWTRVIHVSDNRVMSEVFGTPRMQRVYNQLLDIRKILGGSGEMFWKGGFPGYSFKVDPDQDLTDTEKNDLKDELRDYAQGLQRYLSFVGVGVESLEPQVSDPLGHLTAQVNSICVSWGVPKRIFEGSERGELASSQDVKTWNTRIRKRQENYLTPLLVRPFIDRLQAFGILPPAPYSISWPDLHTPSDQETAKVALTRTQAMATYVSGSVDDMVPPQEFLTMVMGMNPDEVAVIAKAADNWAEELGDDPVEPASTAPMKKDEDDGKQKRVPDNS